MIQPGVYKHYKGGMYTVLMTARCSDNGPNEGDEVVIYVSHTTGKVCTRLADEFNEPITCQGGVVVNRFRYYEDKLSSQGER